MPRTFCAADLITGAEAIFLKERRIYRGDEPRVDSDAGVVIHLLLSLALGVALAAGS